MNPRSIKFLIADDHPFIRRIVAEALKGLDGAEFIEVGDGEEALLELGVVLGQRFPNDGSLPARNTFNIGSPARLDCMITDFNMPHVNGLEILRMVRAGLTGARRDLPVFMLTGFDDSSLLAAALQLDVNAFITKPAAKSILLERIEDGLIFPGKLRSTEEYAAIQIPSLDIEKKGIADGGWLEGPDSRPPIINDRPFCDQEEGGQSDGIPLTAVQDGAVLCEDLFSKDGKLVLSKGHVLTSSLVRRLQEISEITGISHVKVADR